MTTPSIPPDNQDPSALYDLIAQQPFFQGLIPAHLQILTASAMEMQFQPGQFLLQEGSPANRFYLILEGRVALETESPERDLIPLETLGPGDELGWSWLFPAHYVQSNARALVPTRTIFFYGTRVAEQCEQDHAFGYQLTRRVAGTLLNRLQTLKKRTTLSTSNSQN